MLDCAGEDVLRLGEIVASIEQAIERRAWIAEISEEQSRWILLACAFPASPNASSKRGIDQTHWVKMEQDFYDQCLDPRDYRPRTAR